MRVELWVALISEGPLIFLLLTSPCVALIVQFEIKNNIAPHPVGLSGDVLKPDGLKVDEIFEASNITNNLEYA